MTLRALVALLIAGAAIAAASDAIDRATAAPSAQQTFHCAKAPTCPEIFIAGDPHAAAVFHGYGDPSLEYDPATDTLWLSYSWLDVLVSDPGPPPVFDFGVRTHLAKSTDGGATFSFVRAVNATTPIQHPDTMADGWLMHEVSTLVREGAGAWQVMWLTYFDLEGESAMGDDRSDFHYRRSQASTPEGLGDTGTAWIQGYGVSPSFGAQHDLSAEIPQLSDCVVFTEPGLFAHEGSTYLATGCIVIDGTGQRVPEDERVVLLRQEAVGYTYLGELLDYDDAQVFGADRLEQVDLSLSRDGAILLTITPIIDNSDPMHQGCVVYQVVDLATAQVLRDGGGQAIQLARITADGNGLGPGLCTYDAESDTGVLLVITNVDLVSDPPDIEFSLRETGIHPAGLSVGGSASVGDDLAPPSGGANAVAIGLGVTAVLAVGSAFWFARRRVATRR